MLKGAASATSLAGRVALVTGASRGIGKGIALQLGQAGATVYITGRTLEPRGGQAAVGGSLKETAEEIEKRGGRCIPVQCDHKIDSAVLDLFDQIKKEQDGRLDLLVNNAFSGASAIMDAISKKQMFYEQDLSMWDEINNVGLRNHYRCSVLASRLMVPRAQGLIVNISSGGGLQYLFNVSYGVGKQAIDRLTADTALELRTKNVAVVSLWPGPVMTEETRGIIASGVMDTYGETAARLNLGLAMSSSDILEYSESTEFPGKAVVALAADPKIMSKSGRIQLSAEVAAKYNFKDIDGRQVMSLRSVQTGLIFLGWKRLGGLVPRWVKIPYPFMTLAGHRFDFI